MAYYRPDVVDLIRMQGGAMYGGGRVYEGRAGSGLIGGGLIGGGLVVGKGLPKALKTALYDVDPSYRSRVDKMRARGGPPVAPAGSVEAKARAAKAQATRRATNAEAATAALDQDAKSGGVSSLRQLHEMYAVNKIAISYRKRAEKRAEAKVSKGYMSEVARSFPAASIIPEQFLSSPQGPSGVRRLRPPARPARQPRGKNP